MRFIPAVSPVQIQSPPPYSPEMCGISGESPFSKIRPVGQVVKTRPFHGCNMGSSPVRVTTSAIRMGCRIYGGLAQLVRAPASHAGGHWFESSSLHHEKTLESQWFRGFFFAFFWKKRASLLAVFWGIFGQFQGFLLQKCCKFFWPSIRCATRVCGFLGRAVCCKLFQTASLQNARRTFSAVCCSRFLRS